MTRVRGGISAALLQVALPPSGRYFSPQIAARPARATIIMASTSTATRRRSAAALIALVAAVFVASAAGTVVVARRGAVFNRGVTVTRIGAVAPFSRYGAVVVRGARHLLQAKAPAKAPAQMAKAPAQIAKATTPAAGCKTVLQARSPFPMRSGSVSNEYREPIHTSRQQQDCSSSPL